MPLSAVDHQQRQAEPEEPCAEPVAALAEPIEREARLLVDVGDGKRRVLDGRRVPLGVHQHMHRAALDREHQRRPADDDDAEPDEIRDERAGVRLQPGDRRRQGVLQAAVEQVEDAAAGKQRQQERRADDRHHEQRLERRLGDELDDDEFPVGCRDQRAALEGRLDVTRTHRVGVTV